MLVPNLQAISLKPSSFCLRPSLALDPFQVHLYSLEPATVWQIGTPGASFLPQVKGRTGRPE